MSRDVNARGRQATLGHLRGIDGVRAFSVLSGFPITSLLLAEWGSSATIRLRGFWAR